jgi:hypothetical protein
MKRVPEIFLRSSMTAATSSNSKKQKMTNRSVTALQEIKNYPDVQVNNDPLCNNYFHPEHFYAQLKTKDRARQR